MNLLIVTQAVDTDDPALGFFHRWIEEFAKRCAHVEVVCLKKGAYELPDNVSVHSLGKEVAVQSRYVYTLRFLALIWGLRSSYDAVFVHMNPEYVALGGPLWRAWGKKIGLWYVHSNVTVWLRLAVVLAHVVFTSAPESMRVASDKARIVGHGIDLTQFASRALPSLRTQAPRLLAVGRVTPIKNLDIAIRALRRIRESGVPATLTLVGPATPSEDQAYQEYLKQLATEEGVSEHVTFAGPIPHASLGATYAEHDIALNLSPTGGIDKVVLEAMAAGLPVIVANTAFRSYLEEYADALICADRDPEAAAICLRALLSRDDLPQLQADMRRLARSHADLSTLVPAIMKSYGSS